MIRPMTSPPAWTPELLDNPHAAPDKSGRVRRMFNAIAPRYQCVNSLFSFGRDRAWRRKAVAMAQVRPDDIVLDVACGTGDFSRAFAEAGPQMVIGSDFAHEMLTRAGGAHPSNARRCPTGNMGWVEADALRLPLHDASVSIVSCAFGVRNFENLASGLREFHRVLRPGGRAVILEFTRPRNRAVRGMYELYSNHIMPAAATWVSGDKSGAYRYLPKSVVSFHDAAGMENAMLEAGFVRVSGTPLTFGVVTVYVGFRE